MMYQIGDLVTIVANPQGKNTAAFKRFKRGEENVYRVVWIPRYHGRDVEVKWVNKGRNTNSFYYLSKSEILPLDFFGLTKEDFL